MTTASYPKMTFGEVTQWLTQNGDNKSVNSYYRGIKLDNPSHRRDAEAILTALVKLRQRDETKIANTAHKNAFNTLEADIVDFCSHALMSTRSDIKHSANKEVYLKFQALRGAIDSVYPYFLTYNLTTQVSLRYLFRAGLMAQGAPCSTGLLKLKNKNFRLNTFDSSKPIFEQLVINKLIKLEGIWSNSVTALSRNHRLEFGFSEQPRLVRIEVQVADALNSEILQTLGINGQTLQDYVQFYQKQFDTQLEAAVANKKPIYSADAFLKSVVLQEERDIRNNLQKAATVHAFNALVDDPQSLKDKIMGLSDEAKRQLLKLVDVNLFK